MNKIFTLILLTLFPLNLYASVDGVIKIIFSTIAILIVVVALLAILAFIFNSGKKKFDDSVVGLSLKIKKEKLKKELEEIEKEKSK